MGNWVWGLRMEDDKMDDITEQQLQEVSNMLQQKAAQQARRKAYEKLPDWAKTASNVVMGAGAGVNEMLDRVAHPRGSFTDPLLIPLQGAYGLSDFLVGYKNHPTKYESWNQQMEEEPLFHRYLGNDEEGNPKYELKMETFPEFFTKLLVGKKPEKEILGLEDLEAGLEKYGEGAGAGKSNPLVLPGIGAMPELPNVDWQAIRDRINNINVDTNYEAPQRDPLVALGDFLANIDLTSNLSGDWSKASNKMVEFQKYNEEQEKSAKNKSADKKAELELWKAMKDVAIQEAAANHAMRNAEFGLKWQQAKMNAALAQAKANAFYNTSGPGSEYLDPAYKEGRRIAAMALIENPDLTEKDIMHSLTMANAKFKRQPKQNPNFQLGYTDAMMEGIKELRERKK